MELLAFQCQTDGNSSVPRNAFASFKLISNEVTIPRVPKAEAAPRTDPDICPRTLSLFGQYNFGPINRAIKESVSERRALFPLKPLKPPQQ